jgi:hypothetical protein
VGAIAFSRSAETGWLILDLLEFSLCSAINQQVATIFSNLNHKKLHP